MTRNNKCLASYQVIKAGVTAQLKNSQKRVSSSASESRRNAGICVLKLRAGILREINVQVFYCNVYFLLHVWNNGAAFAPCALRRCVRACVCMHVCVCVDLKCIYEKENWNAG